VAIRAFGAIKTIGTIAGAVRTAWRRVVPARWRGHDWSAPPLIPGQWRTVPPDAAVTLMIRLCAEVPAAAAICAAHDITALRQRRLISIPDGLLIEFQAVPHDGSAPGIGAVIYRPGLFDLIDGEAAVLHHLCWDGAVMLDTAEKALEYTQLFCGAVQGEHGCFFPVRPSMANRVNRQHPKLWSSIKRLASPVAVRRDDEDWAIDMAIAFGDGFYGSSFTLEPSGMIEMLEDDHLCGIAPATAQGWLDGLRFNFPVAPEATNHPCPGCSDAARNERPDHAQ